METLLESVAAALGVDSSEELIWVSIGLAAQALFTARFLVQWVASERQRRSVIPIAFWYFSTAGGAVLLSYALWRGDPVFIIGQSAGLIIYLRNLYFIHIERRHMKEVPTAPDSRLEPR